MTTTEKNKELQIDKKDILLDPSSLFFVDAGYELDGVYLFALSSPINELKGQLELNTKVYEKFMATEYASKFDIPIDKNPKEITIRRQYGMKKVLKSEFDPSRYILRKGFLDFPACPYGHTFKMLGYDMQTKTYVRLAPAILREKSLKILKYKE